MGFSGRENASAVYKQSRKKWKRTSNALVKRNRVGECDQCERTMTWTNLPRHYVMKHKAIYYEKWRKRGNGELIDHAASVQIKKRRHARISATSVGQTEAERIGADSADPADGSGVADVEQPTTSGGVVDVEQPTTSGDVVDVEQPTTSGGVVDVEQPTTSGGVVYVEQPTTSGGVIYVEQPTTSGCVVYVEQPTTSGGVVYVEQPTTSGGVVDVEEHPAADM